MAKNKNIAFLVILLVSLMLLASCGVLEDRLAAGTSIAGGDSTGEGDSKALETPTPEDIGIDDAAGGDGEDDGLEGPGAIGTAIQQTLDVWDTVTAEAAPPDLITPSATYTATVGTPGATSTGSPTGSEEPTSTVPGWQYTALYNTITAVYGSTETAAIVSSTPTPYTPLPGEPTKVPSPTPVPCLAFRFVTHPNYPPGSVVQPSTSFYKSWYIQNVGSCAWSPGFSLVYDSGFQLGGASPTYIGATIHPGQYVTLTMSFYAPPQPGTYRGTWLLQDTSGNTFGGGDAQDEPLVVEVYVPGTMPPVSTSPASTAPPFTPAP